MEQVIVCTGDQNDVVDRISQIYFKTKPDTVRKEQYYLITKQEQPISPFDLQCMTKEQARCSKLSLLKLNTNNLQEKEVTLGLTIWHFKPRGSDTYRAYVPGPL